MALVGLSFNNAMHAACSRGGTQWFQGRSSEKRPGQLESIQQPLAAHFFGICGAVASNLFATP